MTLRQILLAYHLVRGTLKGPATKIKEVLDNPDSPYFDFRPEDILPILRPVRTSNFPIQQEYRGCRMLSICCIDYRTTFSYTALPRIVFVFDVHYCLRRHTVEVSGRRGRVELQREKGGRRRPKMTTKDEERVRNIEDVIG